MILIPESIQGRNTLALEQEWTDVLKMLPVEMLKIDFDNEIDVGKMRKWLEQFGVPGDLIPESEVGIDLLGLLKMAIKMYRIGGTESGIKAIAEALGATEVTVHTGAYMSNKERNNFSSSLLLTLPSGVDHEPFRISFDKLFQLFSPVSLWLNDIKGSGGVLNNNFNSRFK